MAHLLKTFSVASHHSWVKDHTWSGPWFCLCSHFLPCSAHSLHTSVLTISQQHQAGSNPRPFVPVVPSAWTNCGLTLFLISFKLQMFPLHRHLHCVPYRNRAIPLTLFFLKLLYFFNSIYDFLTLYHLFINIPIRYKVPFL